MKTCISNHQDTSGTKYNGLSSIDSYQHEQIINSNINSSMTDTGTNSTYIFGWKGGGSKKKNSLEIVPSLTSIAELNISFRTAE
jgi:hypothetical protein